MKCVVLNPGHVFYSPGDPRNTPGKCSPDKSFYEAVWNKEVAIIVQNILHDEGIDSIIASAESEKTSLSTPVKICNDVCHKYGNSSVLFVSIHVNALGDGSSWYDAKGWSVWTTRGVTNSDKLANFMYNSAVAMFPDRKVRADKSDGDPDYESNFYVIKNVKCPAVLVEHFFMTNKEDLQFLKTEDCKQRCAKVIVEGIKSYFNV